MRRVAITGISGYIGSRLCQRLDALPQVERIVGIDLREPRLPTAKVALYLRDINRPLESIFTENGIDTAIHLAFVLRPTHDQTGTRRTNVGGGASFLDACRAAGVKHILYLSSTSAYGAHPDNPIPLTEESPLRPNKRFQYSRDKAETDSLFWRFAAEHRETKVTILRGCVVMGPGGAGSIGSAMFQPIMVRVAGHNPPVQYVHEDDLLDLMIHVIENGIEGVFNVAGNGTFPYSDLAAMARRPMVAVPSFLLKPLMDLAWGLRLQSGSSSPGLDFIKYPWVVSTEKLTREAGFNFRFSSRDAIMAYVEAKRNKGKLVEKGQTESDTAVRS